MQSMGFALIKTTFLYLEKNKKINAAALLKCRPAEKRGLLLILPEVKI